MHDKKETIKFILQIFVSILTAVLTALGTASCVRSFVEQHDTPTTPDTTTADSLVANVPILQLVGAPSPVGEDGGEAGAGGE